MLNKFGIYMYWNNTWLNCFNSKIFLNKSNFLENLFLFIFSEKIFDFFYRKRFINFNIKFPFFKKSLLIKKKNFLKFNKTKSLNLKIFQKNKKILNKKFNYNFTRVWFVKYNNYILISTFVFFFFKTHKVKISKFLSKPNKLFLFGKKTNVFWKRKKNKSFKKQVFKNTYRCMF